MKLHRDNHKTHTTFLVILFGIISLSVKGQPRTVTFNSPDRVPVTADIYAPNPSTAPVILLFHQAKYSRGEYIDIAPVLNSIGYNCIAVDLRSGGDVNGILNETWKYADSLHMETRYTDAYNDIRAAVSYAKKTYPGAKLFLFGSSYSASLSLKYAGDNPTGINGVVAFSPGEYFSKFGWSRDIIQVSASRVKCPVFIASSKTEEETWIKIYDAIPMATKSKFVIEEGKHGAKVLWKVFPESAQYMKALKEFLVKYK